MSMSCVIEIKNDITELTKYANIKKISEFANRIKKNSIDYGHKSPHIEISYGGKTYKMNILKDNHNHSVEAVEFFDHFFKQKRFFLVYSPYKKSFNYGITYEKKDKKSDVAVYSLKIRKKGNKIYISKNLFFDGNRLASKQTKEFVTAKMLSL